jgi:hypothetical protein
MIPSSQPPKDKPPRDPARKPDPAIEADARAQLAASRAKPNPGGLVSAKPTVLSGDGDATFDHKGAVEEKANGPAASRWGDRKPGGKPSPRR